MSWRVSYTQGGGAERPTAEVDHSTGEITLSVPGEEDDEIAITAPPLGMREVIDAILDAMERLALRLPDGNDRVSVPVLIAADSEEAKKVLRCHGESLRLAGADDLARLARGS